MTKPRVIYWFRTDLRLHDSPALAAALALDPSVLFPIWCWDSHYVYHARVGPNRFQFLLDCQNDLSASITKLNPKSKLFVVREPAVTLLPKLFKAWGISHLVFEKDTDAYARERDATVMEEARKAGVEVIVKSGRTLWDSDEVVKANGGKPTMSITQLQAAGAKVGDIAPPVPTPTTFPDPGDMTLDIVKQTRPSSTPDLNAHFRSNPDTTYSSGLAGPNNDFSPPTLSELGMPAATTPHKGGETVVLSFLDKILADEEYTGTFEKPKTSPAAFSPQSTFLTSPYLHFGALSCRHFYHAVDAIVARRKKAKQPTSSPPTSLTGQLLFRDMYFAAQAALGHKFGQTAGNPKCRFIPWHLPSKIDPTTSLITGAYETDSAEAEAWFQRWRTGTTGFPWIDAIMRQLRREGWIHHLARHSVACFLTRGGCYVSWERGAEVFEEFLIDHETACNAGNWQWLSCTAFFAQFYRCYSPVAFGKKWDEEGEYVRRYVPELRELPKKYIYEPHKAPLADQKKAGVVIAGDGGETERDGRKVYPKPMFDFAQRRDVCLAGMKEAYGVGMYGSDERVLDGTWKKAFGDGGEGPTEGKKGGPGGMTSWVGVDEGEDGGADEEEVGDEGEDEDEDEKESKPSKKKQSAGKEKGKKKEAQPTKAKDEAMATRGRKREHSQGQATLDGTFKKKAK